MERIDSTVDSKCGDWRTTLAANLAARGARAKFAREIECSESHLSLVLKGDRGLSWAMAKKVSDRTGIAMDDLMSPALGEAEK
jgi:hypothetical protein